MSKGARKQRSYQATKQGRKRCRGSGGGSEGAREKGGLEGEWGEREERSVRRRE